MCHTYIHTYHYVNTYIVVIVGTESAISETNQYADTRLSRNNIVGKHFINTIYVCMIIPV